MSYVLVIDDNRLTADAMASMLKMLDLQVRAVYSPAAALAILGDALPDAVMLDVNMPGVNGFEVLSFLKREPRLENVPVFIVTSDDQPQTALKARNLGARDVIIKPAMPEVVEEALRTAGVIR